MDEFTDSGDIFEFKNQQYILFHINEGTILILDINIYACGVMKKNRSWNTKGILFYNYEKNQMALSRRYHNLFISQKFVDCSFEIEDQTLQCHKIILSAASPVFEAMFFGPLNETKPIKIMDISFDPFFLMIKFIYTGDIILVGEKLETCIELYYCAEKYMLEDLSSISLKAIKSKFRFNNILFTLNYAVIMNFQPLLDICIKFFDQCCISSKKFMSTLDLCYYHVSKDCLKYLIKIVNLNWFVQVWAQHERKLNDNYNLEELNALEQINHNENECLNKIVSDCSEYVQRAYYKACSPFVVTALTQAYEVILKSNCFLSLIGIIINSRLMPQHISSEFTKLGNSLKYTESLKIEIFSVANRQCEHSEFIRILQMYNSDLIITLNKRLFLSPDEEYCIRISWNREEDYGSEYPCSLLSNMVGEITFNDRTAYNGSLLTGLKVIKLT